MTDFSLAEEWVATSSRKTAPSKVTYPSGLLLAWDGDSPSLVSSHMSWLHGRGKRALDFFLAASLIALVSPVLILAMLAIRVTSRGPILFKQVRVGLGGRPFTLFKFRTMLEEQCDDTGLSQPDCKEHLTPVGLLLRRTSMDELPQLLNVLKGDMSLVGPRPHVCGQLAAGRPYSELVPYYHMREAVRPGLTGWAQANGYRGSTEGAENARARIEHDIAYIQNASPWLDLRILVQTVAKEFLLGTGR